MFKIDFKESFIISIHIESDYYDDNRFDMYVNFLKSISLYWDKDIRYWKVPYGRIDEVIMWFNKFQFDYIITREAKEEYNNFKQNNFIAETKFFRNRIFDESLLVEGKKLKNFQRVGINWFLKRSRAYIADDAGTGKTITAISIFSQLFFEKEIDSVFIIVRIGMSYDWLHEILKFSKLFTEDDIHIITNENKKTPFEHIQDKKIIIVSNHLIGDVFASYKSNYDKVKKLSDLKWNKPYVNIKEKWNKKSIALIIDEAHELKNTKVIRSKALLSHKDFFEYRYLLSATPAINRFEDWWTGLNTIDKGIIPYSENAFKVHISNDIGDSYSLYNINTYNQEHINDTIEKMSLYVLKRLKKDLPEINTKPIVKPVYLRMTTKQQELYKSFIQNEILRLKQEFDTVTLKLILQKYPYLVQIIDNPELLIGKVQSREVNEKLEKWKFEHDSRLIYLTSALDDYIGNLKEKVIIFDNHPLTLDKLAEIFKKYKPLVIHGKLKDGEKERKRKRDIFNDINSENKLLLFSTQIGGAGYNLHHACRRIIFYTLPNDATLTKQAKERVDRATSTLDSLIEILLIDHTIDIIRYERNISRIELNDNFLNKSLSENEINQLFLGAFSTNK